MGPARLSFLRRIADVDPAHLEAIGREMYLAVAVVYASAAAWCALALAAAHVTWHALGVRGVRRFLALDALTLLWVVVAGGLRLMAVHPYARDGGVWGAVEPAIRGWWSPDLALAVTVASALALAASLTRPLGRRPARLLAAAPLLLFAPLLGPGALDVKVPSARAAKAPAGSPPAVVIIGVDSLRPDFVSSLGGPPGRTPHIDAFLDDAFVFTEARVPIGRTHPSWISLLTARTPDRHGVRYNRPHPWFSERLPTTLAGHLRERGWRTRFLTDDDLFSTLTDIHGFDTVEQPPSVLRTYAADHLLDFGLMTLLPARLTQWALPDLRANRALHQNYDAGDFTARVTDALDEEQAAGGPFLLCAHLCVLHYPGTQPGPDYRAYQPEGQPALGYFKVALGRVGREEPRTSRPRASRVTGLYAAGVANADVQVGRLMAHLRRTGIYDRAWVVLWSDHGESFTDSTGRPVRPNHGVYVDNGDQDLRIVLALKAPRGQGSTDRLDRLVRSLDVAPTLLDWLDLPPLAGAREGVSLRPAMEGAPLPDLEHYAESGLKWGRVQSADEPPYGFSIMQSFRALPGEGDLVTRRRFHAEIVLGKHRALRVGRWKVAYHPTVDGGRWNLWDATGQEPGDLQDRYPDVFAALTERLQAHLEDAEPARLRAASGGEHPPLTPPWWPWVSPPPAAAAARRSGGDVPRGSEAHDDVRDDVPSPRTGE